MGAVLTAWPAMVDLLPEQEIGEARVEHYDLSEVDVRRDRAIGIDNEPGRYARLFVGGTLMMTDTQHERRTAQRFIDNCRGNVLVAGLGLGWVLHAAAEKADTITVVEKSLDVIRLVSPTLPPGVQVVCADIFDSEGAAVFDAIWLDIWASPKNLYGLDELKARATNWLRPGGWIGAWSEELQPA